jgi:hypothetical protein
MSMNMSFSFLVALMISPLVPLGSGTFGDGSWSHVSNLLAAARKKGR